MSLAKHFAKLVRRHKVEVTELPYELKYEAHAKLATREVFATAVVDEETYAIGMHELGHVASEHSDERIVQERRAWDWARTNTADWTETMKATEWRVMGAADEKNDKRITYERQHLLDGIRANLKEMAVARPLNFEKVGDFMKRRKSPRWRSR